MYIIYVANYVLEIVISKILQWKGFSFHPPLFYGHLVLESQVFDTRPEKIFSSFILMSDDSHLYTVIHPLEKSPNFH